jgi:energy-coupling factor transporter ATP-binding protein EcfA2
MNILREILDWSKDLPDWQGDAIARLFAKQNLSNEDIDDLYALLKAEHGISDPEKRTAKKLRTNQISGPTHSEKHVELLCIKNLKHVNAIAKNQKLSFGAKGLTVIYGDNGSGKSGYSRVLKQACRARDQSEPILPNANQPSQAGIAEAIFEINVNGEVREEIWRNDSPAHEDLSTIAIFDHRCARAYVDDEDDFSYVPYGLDIFEGLADLCNQLKERITQELSQCTIDTGQFDDLKGTTNVGRLIENLSSETDPNQVKELAIIKPEDKQKHSLLNRSLNYNNPIEKAEQLQRSGQRFIRIADNVKKQLICVSEAELTRFSELDRKFLSAKAASEIAAKKFNETGQLLPGTGGEKWRELFEAARRFSEVAYPGHSFPHTSGDAKCLLCQQPLENAGLRLKQFEEFVQQDTEQTAGARQKDLDSAKQNFFDHDLFLGLDDETIAEIAIHDKKLAQECKDFEKQLTKRYCNISAAFNSHNWSDVEKILLNPSENLELLAKKLNNESDILAKAAQCATRRTLEDQFNELDSKIRFSPRKEAILTVIEKKRRKSILEKCLSAVKTNAISLKAKEIAETIITRDLGDALNKEFKNLGVADLNVDLKSRSEKGKPLYKLRLNLSNYENPSKILSEGEQRAIAIGSFLAEVDLNGGTGGIIFDDPVSSLDHRRRERVAKRLAQESLKRQVIILTHDVYFLCVLIDEAEKAGVLIETRSLVKKPYGFGVPEPGNPFEGLSTKDRVKFLRAQQQEITKIFKAGDDEEYRRRTVDAYQLLRNTWERAVEEVLFQKVVLRFRKGIETQRLKGVMVENTDYLKVEQGMTKCSNYSHDKALMGGVAVPDPDELLEDINMLESWRLDVEKRSEGIRKKRK